MPGQYPQLLERKMLLRESISEPEIPYGDHLAKCNAVAVPGYGRVWLSPHQSSQDYLSLCK